MSNVDDCRSEIRENLARVRETISLAARRAGRDPGSIKLIAVSKTKPIEMIRAAFELGQISFGENYVQEAVEKVARLPDADWHFIGSLQTNKVRPVVGKFSLIHGVDRAKLARELGKAAAASGIVQDVLLQLHVGGEETKHGVSVDQAPDVIESIVSESSLRLRGLMAMPPLVSDEVAARRAFASVRETMEQLRTQLPKDLVRSFDQLSIGTTSDYVAAILEGATMIRVGTAIFGARIYSSTSRH